MVVGGEAEKMNENKPGYQVSNSPLGLEIGFFNRREKNTAIDGGGR